MATYALCALFATNSMCGIHDSLRSKRSPRMRTTPNTFSIGSEPIVNLKYDLACATAPALTSMTMYFCFGGSKIRFFFRAM